MGLFNARFTCPKCGSHYFGSSGSSGEFQRYCGGPDDGGACGFTFPQSEDYKYFTINGHHYPDQASFDAADRVPDWSQSQQTVPPQLPQGVRFTQEASQVKRDAAQLPHGFRLSGESTGQRLDLELCIGGGGHDGTWVRVASCPIDPAMIADARIAFTCLLDEAERRCRSAQ